MADFNDLKLPELKAVAEQFGVELSPKDNKPDIINKIQEDGVTYQMYVDLLKDDEEEEEDLAFRNEPAPAAPVVLDENVEPSKKIVLKMTRKNHTYQVRGYEFTQQHPFALVDVDDAEYLIEFGGGFRPASPKEMATFYGR